MITDACVYTDGSDTSIRRFALNAASCKFSRIIAVGENLPAEYAGVEILHGMVISAESKDFQDGLRRARGMVILVNAGENSFNRSAVSAKNVRFLTGLADLPKHGFDDVISRMMASRKCAAVFDLSRIIDGKSRRNALSHYAEVLKFARKFHFPVVIASGASSCLGQRTVRECIALCSLFGMECAEVYQALEACDAVLYPHNPVEVIE